MDRPLSPREAAFVAEYLLDGNGYRAAVAAGYKPIGARVQASRMLTRPNVAAAIRQAQMTAEQEATVSRAWALLRLKQIAEQDEDLRAANQALATMARMEGWNAPEQVDSRQLVAGRIEIVERHAGPDQEA